MPIKMVRPQVATLDTRSAKPPPKEVDPFYLTTEYQAWREKVIANARDPASDNRPRCQWIENGRRCFKTEPHVRLFADHIDEMRDGGAKLDPRNGQALCGSHHVIKTNIVKCQREQAQAR